MKLKDKDGDTGLAWFGPFQKPLSCRLDLKDVSKIGQVFQASLERMVFTVQTCQDCQGTENDLFLERKFLDFLGKAEALIGQFHQSW